MASQTSASFTSAGGTIVAPARANNAPRSVGADLGDNTFLSTDTAGTHRTKTTNALATLSANVTTVADCIAALNNRVTTDATVTHRLIADSNANAIKLFESNSNASSSNGPLSTEVSSRLDSFTAQISSINSSLGSLYTSLDLQSDYFRENSDDMHRSISTTHEMHKTVRDASEHMNRASDNQAAVVARIDALEALARNTPPASSPDAGAYSSALGKRPRTLEDAPHFPFHTAAPFAGGTIAAAPSLLPSPSLPTTARKSLFQGSNLVPTQPQAVAATGAAPGLFAPQPTASSQGTSLITAAPPAAPNPQAPVFQLPTLHRITDVIISGLPGLLESPTAFVHTALAAMGLPLAVLHSAQLWNGQSLSVRLQAAEGLELGDIVTHFIAAFSNDTFNDTANLMVQRKPPRFPNKTRQYNGRQGNGRSNNDRLN